VAALDAATRFERAGQVTSYLGLVPREYSSGETQRRGRVIRSAHPQVQSLLVQAAWRVSRSSDPRTAPLRAWAQGIARRRGKKVAMVALARRLARMLFAMWRDQKDYQPKRMRTRQAHPVSDITADTGTAAQG
jgi:transposase